MPTLLITPKNKTQADKLVSFAKSLGLHTSTISNEDKEDAALLKAMIQEEKKSKKNVRLSTFLKSLAS